MPPLFRALYVCAALAFSVAPALADGTAGTEVAEVAELSEPAGMDSPLAENYLEADVWGRIRSGYAIADLRNGLVDKHVNWYSSRPEHMIRVSSSASRFLYHVVQELEKRNMPTELALLPIIESAFNPLAYSSADAAGIWQFVPNTGRAFNLKQNMFKDERHGVIASTDAALSYLQQLYEMFGDWPVALAAYNWGEGNVRRAIMINLAEGKPTDFDSLSRHMPPETRNYVPKLQAVKNIVANPLRYGVRLPVIDNQPYFAVVNKTVDIDLVLAAKLAELSVAEFKALNPQFKRPLIPGGERTKILLPQQNAEKFHANLARWGRALSSWTTHKIVGARVSIATLASKFNTTPELIRQANNIPARTSLKAGSTVLVPRSAASPSADIADHVIDNAVLSFAAERAKSSKAEKKRKQKKRNSKKRSKRPKAKTDKQR